jgi:hypothetical protein
MCKLSYSYHLFLHNAHTLLPLPLVPFMGGTIPQARASPIALWHARRCWRWWPHCSVWCLVWKHNWDIFGCRRIHTPNVVVYLWFKIQPRAVVVYLWFKILQWKAYNACCRTNHGLPHTTTGRIRSMEGGDACLKRTMLRYGTEVQSIDQFGKWWSHTLTSISRAMVNECCVGTGYVARVASALCSNVRTQCWIECGLLLLQLSGQVSLQVGGIFSSYLHVAIVSAMSC